jgi:hypothetical protein
VIVSLQIRGFNKSIRVIVSIDSFTRVHEEFAYIKHHWYVRSLAYEGLLPAFVQLYDYGTIADIEERLISKAQSD